MINSFLLKQGFDLPTLVKRIGHGEYQNILINQESKQVVVMTTKLIKEDSFKVFIYLCTTKDLDFISQKPISEITCRKIRLMDVDIFTSAGKAQRDASVQLTLEALGVIQESKVEKKFSTGRDENGHVVLDYKMFKKNRFE